MIPTIQWDNDRILMIDQRKLPARVEWFVARNYRDVIKAIQRMVIRGAPAIGVAAAMGLAMGGRTIKAGTYGPFMRRLQAMAAEMAEARPTAVNLRWAVERMLRLAEGMSMKPVDVIKAALRAEAERILAEDIAVNQSIGRHGASLVPDEATILTHCNAGSLATGGYGTALGVIRAAWDAGKMVRVYADETRPWLQGLRLTAYEMMEEGIPVWVIADNAAGSFMRQGRIQLVVTGADRIAANGDVANKIGTYQVAVLAKENGIPFYVAAPLSTIDPAIPDGDHIPVEERDPAEICQVGGKCIGPEGVAALNPAFDITPARYVKAIITEKGILYPPYSDTIKKVLEGAAPP